LIEYASTRPFSRGHDGGTRKNDSHLVFHRLAAADLRVLILGAGIWDVFSPPVPAVVLNKLHAGVWWGALLVGIGVVYCVKFRPGTEKRG
jgi:hypothetical protein